MRTPTPPSTVPSPYALVNTNTTASETSFVQNSVLYNLAGQQVGYSPNFVTDANITTTTTSPLVIGAKPVPLGLAGVISGPGGVSITNGGSASLSGTNTYTGPTSVSGGYLALLGPGSIATSSGVNVSAGGVFDISGTNNGASVRSLAGDQSGMVWLGSQTLTITAAQDVFAGTIAGSGGLTLAGGVEALTGTNIYTGPTTINGGFLLVDEIVTGSSNVSVNATGTLAGTGTIDPPASPSMTAAPCAGQPGKPVRHAYDRRYASLQCRKLLRDQHRAGSRQQFQDRGGRIGHAWRQWHRGGDAAARPL